MKNKNLQLNCLCGGYHFVDFGDDSAGVWQYMVNADNKAPWYFRIVEGIKYMCGKNLNLHDVVLSRKDLIKLKKFLGKVLKENGKS